MFMNFFAVFIGGGIGAFLRYFISLLTKKYFLMPVLGTFIANMAGCFLIGYIYALSMDKANNFPQTIKLLITVGFLGGLTTFSTLNLEIFELFKTGKILFALSYLFLSCFVGLLLTYIGYFLYSKLH